jgi:hypothetical protein
MIRTTLGAQARSAPHGSLNHVTQGNQAQDAIEICPIYTDAPLKVGPKMLKKGVICAALLSMSMTALAENWKVFQWNNDTTLRYDTESITHKGKITATWVSATYAQPAVRPGYSVPLTRQVSHWIFNCADKTTAIGQVVSYGADGNQVDSNPGDPNDFRSVTPHSVADAMMNTVCPR